MANSLIKNTTLETVVGIEEIPAVPYRPATPPRTVYERRNVCMFRYSGPGHYVFTTDQTTGEVTGQFIPDSLAGTSGGLLGTWSCQDEIVPVTYPGTPAQAAQPGRTVQVSQTVPGFNLGWNAAARSQGFFTDDGYATFQARQSIVGAIVGLNTYQETLDVSGRSIPFAFLLSHGIARIMEGGVEKAYIGAYTQDSVFKIDRTADEITYLIDGVVVYTSEATSAAPLVLQASLYSAGDEIFNPALAQVSAPDLTAGTGSLDIELPALQMLASEGAYAELDINLPPLEFSGEVGMPVPAYGLLNIELPPLAFDGTGLTGEIGSIDLELPALKMLAADHPYGELDITLPPLDFFGWADAPGESYMQVRARVGVAMSVFGTEDLEIAFGARADVALELVPAFDLEIGISARAGLTLVLLEEVDLVITFGARLAVPMTLAGADGEVWVMNMKGNGSTSYADFPFTSFARIGDRYYGAAADGIYELDGDDDAGVPIRASFSPGKLDFGSSAKKTVSHCYLGMAGSGDMLLRIEAEKDGKPVSYVYRARAHSDHLRQERITLGKGLRSSYVVPTFYNEEGADFEIDATEFLVADLTRKI